MGRRAVQVAWAGLWLAGCWRGGRPPPGPEALPLQVEQVRAYPEAATGRFVSLADFEDSPILRQPGHRQVEDFSIEGPAVGPAPAGGGRRFVVNITRTGAGALEADLPPGASLVYRLSGVHDFSRYTLLGMAIYSRGIRDDLKVRVSTDRAAWESLPVLLRDGWNHVLLDLDRLKALKDFDAKGVRSVGLSFSAAREPVRINLDDVMLIDNRREVHPVPEGMRLVKTGLDYELDLPGRSEPVRVRQGDDGLWRLGRDQAVLALSAEGAAEPEAPGEAAREDLSAMGPRRVGEVEVLEHNAIRVRLANTWYFPTSAGEWASLAVPMIRWEYTAYGDGRLVTDVVINAAGGAPLRGVRLTAPMAVVFSDGRRARSVQVGDLAEPVSRFSFLAAPQSDRKRLYEGNYCKPARLEIRMGDKEPPDGDPDGDGFDQSQGCYCLRERSGHCRFVLSPSGEPLADAVVRVGGRWSGSVTAGSEGLALRNLVHLADGSVLVVLPGVSDRPRGVEVTGPVPLVEGP